MQNKPYFFNEGLRGGSAIWEKFPNKIVEGVPQSSFVFCPAPHRWHIHLYPLYDVLDHTNHIFSVRPHIRIHKLHVYWVGWLDPPQNTTTTSTWQVLTIWTGRFLWGGGACFLARFDMCRHDMIWYVLAAIYPTKVDSCNAGSRLGDFIPSQRNHETSPHAAHS